MSEPVSDRTINVTAQEREHPSIRKLARACIALARHQLPPSDSDPVGANPPQPTPTKGQSHGARRSEGGHD